MGSIGDIFTSTYHTKQLNLWPNSSASRLVNYSQLLACQGDMEPFEGDPSTHGLLTSLRNKPQQKQPRQLSASILVWTVSQCIQLCLMVKSVSYCCVCVKGIFSQIRSHICTCISLLLNDDKVLFGHQICSYQAFRHVFSICVVTITLLFHRMHWYVTQGISWCLIC